MFIKIKDTIINVRTVKMVRISGKVIHIHGESILPVICDDEDETKKEFEKVYDRLRVTW